MQHGTDLYQVIIQDGIMWQEERTSLESFKARDYNKRMGYGDPLWRYTIVLNAGKTCYVWTKVRNLLPATHGQMRRSHTLSTTDGQKYFFLRIYGNVSKIPALFSRSLIARPSASLWILCNLRMLKK